MLHKTLLLASAALIAGCATTAETGGPRAAAALADVKTAMGADDLSSITMSGYAWTVRNGFRQTRAANPPWYPRNEITDYVRTIDLDAPASLATGETYAENIFHEPPTPGVYTQNIAAGQDAWAQQLNIWLTPWGFIKGAEENGVSLSTEDGVRVLTWASPEDQTAPSGLRYRVNAYIGETGLIGATETWVEDALMGDMRIAARYSDYQEIDGVMVPRETEIIQGGGAVFGVTLTDADANPENLAELMAAPQGGPGGFFGGPPGGPAPDPADLVEELAPGVWRITGGYTALVVEFEDDLVVFESGQSPARGVQILAAVATISQKPIRGVVVSHPHSDHTGGVSPVLAAGHPLIVSANAVGFWELVLSTPRDLLGEPMFATTELVAVPDGEVMVIEDSMNRLELHHVDNLHTDSMLFGYLPEHSLAIQADFTVRFDEDGNTLGPDGQTLFIRQLAEHVIAHDMEFDRMIGVHAETYDHGSDDVLMALE